MGGAADGFPDMDAPQNGQSSTSSSRTDALQDGQLRNSMIGAFSKTSCREGELHGKRGESPCRVAILNYNTPPASGEPPNRSSPHRLLGSVGVRRIESISVPWNSRLLFDYFAEPLHVSCWGFAQPLYLTIEIYPVRLPCAAEQTLETVYRCCLLKPDSRTDSLFGVEANRKSCSRKNHYIAYS